MTETEARRQYKREWAKRNRDKVRATYQRFYEKKAAEYEAANQNVKRMTAAEKMTVLAEKIEELEYKISHPETAISEWRKQINMLTTEYDRLEREAAV